MKFLSALSFIGLLSSTPLFADDFNNPGSGGDDRKDHAVLVQAVTRNDGALDWNISRAIRNLAAGLVADGTITQFVQSTSGRSEGPWCLYLSDRPPSRDVRNLNQLQRLMETVKVDRDIDYSVRQVRDCEPYYKN